jgi:transposase
MAMGRRRAARQESMWVASSALPAAPAHPFYERLNEILARAGFDAFVEAQCRGFYADRMGRPSLAPGVYFRLLLIGYFEGIDSERGIAWRVADSMALRSFLGFALTDATPDHSTLSRNRRLIDGETHQAVFAWVLQRLAQAKLLEARTLGVDATTLEANAALRSIVRRDTGESYSEFLTRLAQASGIATPTREDLARIDRERRNKGSNDDWEHPYDPDARITKMKDGRTHLAHKAEHAVDLATGAIVAVTLQPADRGDTQSLGETLQRAGENLTAVMADAAATDALAPRVIQEVVADKGYHSNAVMTDLKECGVRTYVSEPNRGRRCWTRRDGTSGDADERLELRAAQRAVYGNRRRIRGSRGRGLMRRRGEYLERSFAHCYDTGGMRRTHLRHHDNILKRLLIHVAGFNLSLILRALLGWGTARGVQDRLATLWAALSACAAWLCKALGPIRHQGRRAYHRGRTAWITARRVEPGSACAA